MSKFTWLFSLFAPPAAGQAQRKRTPDGFGTGNEKALAKKRNKYSRK